MKRILSLLLLWYGCLSITNASDVSQYSASLSGSTGLVITPTAYGLKRNHGNVGLWGEMVNSSGHELYLLYGVRNWLEVGIESDLPYHTTPNFLFKINSQAQDRLFKGFPLLAFGLYRSTSYLAASYKIMPLMLNVGTTISQSGNPLFYGASLQIAKNTLIQIDARGNEYGAALRLHLRQFQFSFAAEGEQGQSLVDTSLRWGAAFHF